MNRAEGLPCHRSRPESHGTTYSAIGCARPACGFGVIRFIAAPNKTITSENTGTTVRANGRRAGLDPAMPPMIHEEAAAPAQPAVMTSAMHVPVSRGNASLVIPRALGKTGPIATPERNTVANANVGFAT